MGEPSSSGSSKSSGTPGLKFTSEDLQCIVENRNRSLSVKSFPLSDKTLVSIGNDKGDVMCTLKDADDKELPPVRVKSPIVYLSSCFFTRDGEGIVHAESAVQIDSVTYPCSRKFAEDACHIFFNSFNRSLPVGDYIFFR
jgi:hypothetical protein